MANDLYLDILEIFKLFEPDGREWAREWLLGWDCDPVGDISALANPMSQCQKLDAVITAVLDPLPDLGLKFRSGAEAVYTWVRCWFEYDLR